MSAFWPLPPLFDVSDWRARPQPDGPRVQHLARPSLVLMVMSVFSSCALDGHICSERQAALGDDEGLRYTPHP